MNGLQRDASGLQGGQGRVTILPVVGRSGPPCPGCLLGLQPFRFLRSHHFNPTYERRIWLAVYPSEQGRESPATSFQPIRGIMSTTTTTEPASGQSRRAVTNPTNTPTSQLERNAANRLRATMAAVKLAFTWLGVRKTLAPEQRTTAARAFHADRELLSASKLILDTKNPAYRAVAAVRSEASGYWRTVTLPFPEAGIRLLPQNSLGLFASTMQTYRERLQEAARELANQYDAIKSEAQRRLGTLYNASDYPSTLDGLFDLEVSYPTIEPPQYLVALSPEVFQQEQARVRERFENAVELAEQAFATELQRLTAHLAERLTGLHDGQPKVFRDSAVENLREFFERFQRLNIRSSPELDALVEQAQQTINGIEPQTLRDSNRLRQMVARDFEQIQASVGELLVDRPRRNILRRSSGGAA